MSIFKRNLKKISTDSEKFLKNFLKRQSINSKLITPMKYGLFSGGKNFRTSIVVNTGKIFKVNYRLKQFKLPYNQQQCKKLKKNYIHGLIFKNQIVIFIIPKI